MKNWLALLMILFLTSCSEVENTDTVVTNEVETDENESLESRAKRHVEASLTIPVNEKYSLKIYCANLDGDDREDAIITVNRYDFAIEEALKFNNTAKRAEVGYMGNYNYIFYYDGALNKISPPQVISSTPQAELTVKFDNITSQVYQDILIDYRIRNSSYKAIYSIRNHTPKRIFHWKNFDGLGTEQKEAYVLKFGEGTAGIQKDIYILKADFDNPESAEDLFTYSPDLRPTKEVLHHFFFVSSTDMYMTKK